MRRHTNTVTLLARPLKVTDNFSAFWIGPPQLEGRRVIDRIKSLLISGQCSKSKNCVHVLCKSGVLAWSWLADSLFSALLLGKLGFRFVCWYSFCCIGIVKRRIASDHFVFIFLVFLGFISMSSSILTRPRKHSYLSSQKSPALRLALDFQNLTLQRLYQGWNLNHSDNRIVFLTKYILFFLLLHILRPLWMIRMSAMSSTPHSWKPSWKEICRKSLFHIFSASGIADAKSASIRLIQYQLFPPLLSCRYASVRPISP
jgi:hypothetical protein